MIDPIAANIEWLGSATSVTTDVASRIYGVVLPQDYNADEDGLAIVVSLRGGPSHEEMPIIYPSIELTVYGPKLAFKECLRVYRSVFDLMEGKNNIPLTSGYIMASENEVMGQTSEDFDNGWATVVSFWKLTMRAN